MGQKYLLELPLDILQATNIIPRDIWNFNNLNKKVQC
jgi:hypothetical protein